MHSLPAVPVPGGPRAVWLRRRPQTLLLALLVLTTLLCFWRLGSFGLRMWDETRHAEVAWQMLQRHDFLNYFYDGQPDDWLAKPPLGIWLIVLSYKLLGFNEWALRLPSALAGIGCVAWTFALVRLYRGPLTALASCLVLITCRGIIGQHISRTGDLDALYICNALGMIYFLARYTRRGERRALLGASLLAGLCFFTKGFMMMMLLPGLGLFLLARGQVRRLLQERYFWLALALLGLFVGGWCYTVKHFATPFVGSSYGRDSWDTMVEYDIWRRFTEKLEGDHTTPFFVLEALDTRFGPWIYLFYTTLIACLVVAWRRGLRLWLRVQADELALLCGIMALSVSLILATSATKFNWYIAITTPFLAILTVQLWRGARRHYRFFGPLALGCALAAVGMQAFFLLHRDDSLTTQILEHLPLVTGAEHIYVDKAPTFNVLLTLKWRGLHTQPAPAELLAQARRAGADVQLIDKSVLRLPGGQGYSVLLRADPE